MENTSIDTLFQEEQVQKTLNLGRIYFLIGILAIAAFAVMDLRQDFHWIIPTLRVFSAIPAVAFIFLSIRFLPANRYLVTPFYNICLTTVLVMITAVTILVRGNEDISEELTSTIMLGTGSVVFISSLAALGAKRQYAFSMGVVMFLFTLFYIIFGLPFLRQLFLIDLIAIFSIVTIRGQYTHEFERFKAAKQVEAKEEQLLAKNEELNSVNKELQSFNRSISHDLKTPLRNAISFTQLLLREVKEPENKKVKDYGDFILRSLHKMNNLINSLFELSKIGYNSLKLDLVDLHQVAREAYEDQISQKHIDERTITFILEDLPALQADPILIGGVMDNLISNAIKYSSSKAQSIIEVGSYKSGDDYTIYVKDNGVGFDQQYERKVFEIFERLHTNTEFEGSGVGLSIVEKIVRMHGGRIWAESEEGKGATFYFTLPAA